MNEDRFFGPPHEPGNPECDCDDCYNSRPDGFAPRSLALDLHTLEVIAMGKWRRLERENTRKMRAAGREERRMNSKWEQRRAQEKA